jgi:hypothetical protein
MIGTNRYIGSPVERIEDLRFLRGRGQFVGDLKREGMLHATILRSPVAPVAGGAAKSKWRAANLLLRRSARQAQGGRHGARRRARGHRGRDPRPQALYWEPR